MNPASPAVVLLSPSGTPNGYFAEQGWISDGSAIKLPDPKAQWTAPEGAMLEPDKPVTLSWDNGEGIVFKRTISLSDHYLFTTHESENKTVKPPSVLPMGVSSVRERLLWLAAGGSSKDCSAYRTQTLDGSSLHRSQGRPAGEIRFRPAAGLALPTNTGQQR